MALWTDAAFYSDNGDPCACGGTIKAYSKPRTVSGLVDTFCYSCHAAGWFFVNPDNPPASAAAMSAAERSRREG